MAVANLDHVLFVGSVVLLLAVLAVRVSTRVGMPSLLIYLAMGVLLSPVLDVEFNDAKTAHSLGFVALVLILAEGGLTTKWAEVRPSLSVGLALATVGVTISVGIVGAAAHLLLGFSWKNSFLIGAITSPTDAAAVFAVLRAVPLRLSLLGALEAESGLNDAPTVLLVVLLSRHSAFSGGVAGFVGLLLYELLGGVAAGFLVGRAGAWMLRRVALPASGLYPITVLAIAVLSYSGAASLHTSGFAAVYISALILGNSELPHRASTRSFAEGVAWLAQIGLFIMLGLLVTPSSITLHDVVGGLVVGAVLTLVARPVSVALCCLPLRVPYAEQVFLACAGLRGAVPIVLATIPLAEQIAPAYAVFNLVFVLVVVLTVVTAPTLPRLASLLGVIVERAREVDVEAAPMERIEADLLQIRITEHSKLHGVEVGELRLRPGTSVSLIVRGPTSFTPDRRTALKRGDDVLIVSPRRDREETERRIQAVSRNGRLAGWRQGPP